MDLHILFSDSSKNNKGKSYYISLGKTAATDICSYFEYYLESLEREKQMQVEHYQAVQM